MRKTTSRHSLPHTLSVPAVLLSVVRIVSSIPATEAMAYLLLNRHHSTNGASDNPIWKAGGRHILYVIEVNNSPLLTPL
jgi:hypothetical protein